MERAITEYSALIGISRFPNEILSRTAPIRQQLEELLESTIRGIAGHPDTTPESLVTDCLLPLSEKVGPKYVGLILQLADLTPEYLAQVVAHMEEYLSYSEETLCSVVKEAVLTYNIVEMGQLLVAWRNAVGEAEQVPEISFKWGQRVGRVLPVVNVKFMRGVLLPLLRDDWEGTVTWQQDYETQLERFKDYYDLELVVPPRKGKEDTMVFDMENFLATMGGVWDTWEWTYHVEQRCQLFKLIAFSMSFHLNEKYPRWFCKATQVNFLGDMVGSTYLTAKLGSARSIDSLICSVKRGMNFHTEEMLVERIRARIHDPFWTTKVKYWFYRLIGIRGKKVKLPW